jgi:hypothetical protein
MGVGLLQWVSSWFENAESRKREAGNCRKQETGNRYRLVGREPSTPGQFLFPVPCFLFPVHSCFLPSAFFSLLPLAPAAESEFIRVRGRRGGVVSGEAGVAKTVRPAGDGVEHAIEREEA